MRRKLGFTLLLVLAAATLSASPRFFLGASFNYDVNNLASSLASNLEPIEDGGVYGGGSVDVLHAVGPRFEVVLFPFGNIPVGIGVNSTTMLNIGYSTPSSGDTVGYFSRNLDFRQDLGAGIYYQQAFGTTWGMFADLSFTYSWYRMATSNVRNSKDEVEYIRFTNYGLSANLGAYLENHGSFFKVGAVLYYDLENASEKAFRYGMTLGGGFSFG